MGRRSEKLMNLRPVTFRYKADKDGKLQYGLVAEEVEKVFPELVAYGADGKPESVMYHVFPAMLLNEVQKQAHQNAAQAEQIKTLSRRVAEGHAPAENKEARLGELHKQLAPLRGKH